MKKLFKNIATALKTFFDCDYENYSCIGSSGRY